MAKFCTECANPINDNGMPFCPKCGFKIPLPTSAPLFCRECGGPRVSETSQFCDKCGANTGKANTDRQNRVIDSPQKKLFEILPLILLLILAVTWGIWNINNTMLSGSVSNDRIFSQDLSSMALTINDFPTGWQTNGAAVNTDDNTHSSRFIKIVGLTPYVVYLDITRYPTVDQAKTEYISKNTEITRFKVESVYLGNEGFGYVNDDSSIIIFRKGNIIVRTQYGVGGFGGSFSSLSISDAKEYAKIVADRIK